MFFCAWKPRSCLVFSTTRSCLVFSTVMRCKSLVWAWLSECDLLGHPNPSDWQWSSYHGRWDCLSHKLLEDESWPEWSSLPSGFLFFIKPAFIPKPFLEQISLEVVCQLMEGNVTVNQNFLRKMSENFQIALLRLWNKFLELWLLSMWF